MSIPGEEMLGITNTQSEPMAPGLLPNSDVEGASIAMGPDGEVIVSLDGASGTGVEQPGLHTDNLVDQLEPGEQTALAQKITDWVRADEDARSDWISRLKDGAQAIGVAPSKMDKMSIKGASEVQHPLIAEAAVQFQARAVEEMLPASGPVKAQVLGDATEELLESSSRVETYMNYHLTVRDEDYVDDIDKMLFNLPLTGSQFRKIFLDPVTGLQLTRTVLATRLLVPYSAANLRESPRITEIITMHVNDLKRSMAGGSYKEVELGTATRPLTDEGQSIADDADNRTQTEAQEDDVRTLYECHCDYEFKFDEGVASYALPYIVTVERDTLKVLAVRRNWKESDPLKLKRLWYVHYKYLPGMGFYGFGLLHIIGSLGAAATGLLRAIIDSAARATFSGGFRSKEARRASTTSPGLGEWIDIDLSAEELAKAFFPLPYKEPGPGVFNALEKVEEGGHRFASTTEAMVGDAGSSGPMGTMMALIEQGSKVFSGIHKRLHNSQGKELRLLKTLMGETLPEEYPYHVVGVSRKVLKSDFSDRVGVSPVSDPSVSSSTQRLGQAQLAMQLIQQAPPGMYQPKVLKKIHAEILKAAKVPYAQQLIDGQDQGPCRYDPVTENQLILTGQQGVMAFQDQDHDAHLVVHEEFIQSLPPALQSKAQGAMLAHLADHVGMRYRVQMMQVLAQSGMPLPPMDPRNEKPIELPGFLENQVASVVAQAAAQVMAQRAMQQMQEAQNQPPPGQQPGPPQQQQQPPGPTVHNAPQAVHNVLHLHAPKGGKGG